MTESIYKLRYRSPRGDEVVLDPRAVDGPYFLVSTTGLMASAAEPGTRAGPGQPGTTLTSIRVRHKVITAQIAIFGATEDEYWDRRRTLVDALNFQPATNDPVPGTLLVERINKPVLQIPVVPQDSPRETGKTDAKGVLVDIEFYAASPYFQSLSQLSVTLESDGGFEFPLEHPWESIANQIEQEIVNPGTVRSPITATMFGDFTNGRLINLTTGETISYIGQVQDGDRVVITTAYGNKRATHIDSVGVETNAMSNLDLTTTDFWELLRDINNVKFEADLNPSGSARIVWRPRYGGL